MSGSQRARKETDYKAFREYRIGHFEPQGALSERCLGQDLVGLVGKRVEEVHDLVNGFLHHVGFRELQERERHAQHNLPALFKHKHVPDPMQRREREHVQVEIERLEPANGKHFNPHVFPCEVRGQTRRRHVQESLRLETVDIEHVQSRRKHLAQAIVLKERH
ncbi:hypothetical protein PsorP6_018184 [Peronosclerospora sorghi]|uniref:Uncharacterized protein n=1 Tax=Peronosclerospora sorghi TaxID=230839 RepID=A0ACC0WEX2_9STRA|nr:hypothetical protein PsorP6_018184 [Peronosclerospora sorghi]